MNIRDWGILIGATIIFGLSLIAIIILKSFYDFSILSPEGKYFHYFFIINFNTTCRILYKQFLFKLEQEKRRGYRNIELTIFYKVMIILFYNIIVTALLIAGIVKVSLNDI